MRISYDTFMILDEAFIQTSDETRIMVITDTTTGKLKFRLSWGSMYEASAEDVAEFASNLLNASKYVQWLNSLDLVIDKEKESKPMRNKRKEKIIQMISFEITNGTCGITEQLFETM